MKRLFKWNVYLNALWYLNEEQGIKKKMYREKYAFTFLDQWIDGTGFPAALHSNVTDPPFLAVTCPVEGTARTLGGTGKNIIKENF